MESFITTICPVSALFPHLDSVLVQNNDAKKPALVQNPKILSLYLEPENLNESQSLAVRHIFTNRSFFSLIHGPPGTGKTRTIVSTVKMFFHTSIINSFRQHLGFENSSPRILICAPSNNAVDELARRITKLRFTDRSEPCLKVIRVGVPNNISDDLKDFTLDHIIENELNEKRRATNSHMLEYTVQEKMKQKFELLKQSNVVCATLSSSAKDMIKIANISFDILIIDEACQSVETSTLIPLKFEPFKTILIGDPRQLPPTLLSQCKLYQQCLFERLMKTHPAIFLNTQYRMDPRISEFPSKFFYDNLLITHKSVPIRYNPYKEFLQPISFIRMSSSDEVGNNHSFINAGEATVVADIIKELFVRVKGYDLTSQIGIITPYRAQQQRIKALLLQIRSDIFKYVTVNTVDGFQGQEKDIIIISAVRSTNIGFLNDIRRMNVSITRSKFALIILGNIQTLSRSAMWKAMINYLNAKRVIYDHWKNLFIQQ